MAVRKTIATFGLILATALAFADLAGAQESSIYQFKGIKIPVNLKIKDAVVESGTLDLEFLKTGEPAVFQVKIIKKGKVLDVVAGREWAYDGSESAVPAKPTLKMARNPDESLLILTFESGKSHRYFPLVRVKFSLPYVE